MRYLILLVLIIGCNTNSNKPDTSNYPEIDKIFSAYTSDRPGCALAVIQKGTIIYKKGYGSADLEHDLPITPQSKFYIGSVSKQFVTFAILLLEEKALLSLDDDVRKYLPEFPDYGSKLTIRHFIHHTSGIRDNLTLWELAGNNMRDYIPKKAIYDLICRQKELNFIPGSQYLYSNSCYFMLGLIIEKVSGQSLKDFAQENIFGPLKMTHSFFYDDRRWPIKNRAFAYNFNKEESKWETQFMHYDLVGSGGIYSTVEDLFLWDQNFYQNQLGNKTQDIIEMMKTDGKLNNGESAKYAFGIQNSQYKGITTLEHGGAMGGYRSYYLQFPELETSIILLSNFSQFDSWQKAHDVADVILAGKFSAIDSDKDNQSKEDDQEVVDNNILFDLKEFTGQYYAEELDVIYKFIFKDNKLWLKIKYKNEYEVIALNDNELEVKGLNIKIKIEKFPVKKFSIDAGRVTNLKFIKI